MRVPRREWPRKRWVWALGRLKCKVSHCERRGRKNFYLVPVVFDYEMPADMNRFEPRRGASRVVDDCRVQEGGVWACLLLRAAWTRAK